MLKKIKKKKSANELSEICSSFKNGINQNDKLVSFTNFLDDITKLLYKINGEHLHIEKLQADLELCKHELVTVKELLSLKDQRLSSLELLCKANNIL